MSPLRFPDRTDFDTVEEYDQTVKKYWESIDVYRDMALEFYNEIMKEKAPIGSKDQEEKIS